MMMQMKASHAQQGVQAHGGAWSRLLSELSRRWFLIGIVLAITLAKTYPSIGAKGGPLKPEVTVRYIAVSLIFFNSGLSLNTDDLAKAVRHYQLHIFIQCFTLVLIPLVVSLLVRLLALSMLVADIYLVGLRVVSCMPPPVSSAVILTKSVGGNEAAAVFNSVFGSFLGIVVTPILLLVLIGTSTSVPFFSIFSKLSTTVVIPLCIGQVVRNYYKDLLSSLSLPHGTISSSILLLIIYTTFCDSFKASTQSLGFNAVLVMIFIVCVMQCSFLLLAYAMANATKMFSRADIIAILFCSTHKSLTLGIPILKVIFSEVEDISGISLPLLVYHPTQILLGSLLVPTLHKWVAEGTPSSSPSSSPPSPPSPSSSSPLVLDTNT